MLIRLEPSFIDTVSQLETDFSEKEKQQLASKIELKYHDIISTIKNLEQKKVKLEPDIIELGNIGSRAFALSIYYSSETETGDIPTSIIQLIPTISPVRIDIMSKLQQQKQSINTDSTYLKAGQVYDDGDIHAKYTKEAIEEDEGLRPIE
jgi:hypothetical protein